MGAGDPQRGFAKRAAGINKSWALVDHAEEIGSARRH